MAELMPLVYFFAGVTLVIIAVAIIMHFLTNYLDKRGKEHGI